MTYNKPEITVLGDAAEVIQAPLKNIDVSDGPDTVNPAYDLDE